MPEDKQQPAGTKLVSGGIMRCGQRCGETLADEQPAGRVFGQPFEHDAPYANASGEAPADDKDAAAGLGEAP